MRLTPKQRTDIHRLVAAHIGAGATVAVFGSRTNDEKRGGDLDLFIEAPAPVSLMRRAALKLALEQALVLPVDLTITEPGKPLTSFQSMAKARATPLTEHRQ